MMTHRGLFILTKGISVLRFLEYERQVGLGQLFLELQLAIAHVLSQRSIVHSQIRFDIRTSGRQTFDIVIFIVNFY